MNQKSMIRKKIVAMKIFLARTYSWIQAPAIVLLLAEAFTPYLQWYYDISLWQVIITLFPLLILMGWVEKKWGFMRAELDYHTDNSGMLKDMFQEVFDKIDKVDNKLENMKRSLL